MAAVMFDTHAVIKRLQESGFSEQQAETMAGVLQDTQKTSSEHLATKWDIQDLQRDIKEIVDWRALADLIETIMVYKLPRLTREEIRKMLNLTEVELKQTRFYQDVFEEGRQEGWQEGRQHQITMILRMLRRRLGSVGPAQEGRIQALPVAELDALGEALLDFQTSDDLSEWFRQRP